MATRPSLEEDEPVDESRITYLTQEEGIALLDQQARKYLGMSGEEFMRKWEAGEIEDPDRTDVLRVAFLIPLAKD
jgi:hypothetical protein